MRLVVGLFAMFLTASVARADEAKAPDPKPEVARAKVPLRVVRVLAETHQALLFNKNRGTHVLADIGGTVDGYYVEDIDDDEVTLSQNGREIVLAAPSDPAPAPAGPRRVVAATRKPVAPVEGPVDPYAETAAPDSPQDPYAEAPVRSAQAPVAVGPGDGGVRVSSMAPDGPAPAMAPIVPAGPPAAAGDAGDPENPYADAPIAPAIKAPAKAPAPAKKGPALDGFLPPGTSAADAETFKTPAPAPVRAAAPITSAPAPIAPAIEDAPAAPAGPVITPTVLSRSELNASIGDFTKLAGILRGSFTPDGARIDSVAEGSVFAKAGLRRGDIVTAVDSTPLRTIDDAADLYVRAASTRAANIQLIRGGKPLTLRVLIQ